MAEITLADYTGYIFVEIVKARQMADGYSRRMAELYAEDQVLRYFSVPRFKVPKMELTIPVLVSGARFKQLIRFNMAFEDFKAYTVGLIKDVGSSVRMSAISIFRPTSRPDISPGRPTVPDLRMEVRDIGGTIEDLVSDFWKQLRENPDPSQPADIVRDMWTRIFERVLTEADLEEAYKRSNPNNEGFEKSLDKILKMVITNTAIDSTNIQSLLVNPETNVVKNGSSDTTVFTIKAEMQEESFFLRAVTDERTGETRTVVDFE
jgi:hypothetical protein